MRTYGRAVFGDERGVALPLALMGLVAVSLLVTTALVTSSNEVALSSAHQRGAQGLYRADEALEGFIATRAGMAWDPDAPRLQTGWASYSLTDGTSYRVSMAELSRATTVSGTSASRVETFSAVAEPADGRGRAVGALIRVTRTSNPQVLNVNSGLTLGVNTTISGNATISDGSDGAAGCSEASAENAIVYGSDNTVSVQGDAATIVGNTEQPTMTGADLISHVFNGQTVDELVEYANIRFGPQFGEEAFNNNTSPSSSATDPDYRWGCPANLMALLSLTCPAGTSTYFPVVAIDANGGTVDIQGDHGQGTLIVVNGTLRIRGNFLYEGIIISEGITQISGTPRIEGAVITMGSETVIDPDDEATNTGTSVIRFNQCSVTSAQAGLAVGSLDRREQIFNNRTTSWFEVVR